MHNAIKNWIQFLVYRNYIFRIKVTFNKANGDKITAEGKKGDSLLDVIINNNLDFDGYGMIINTKLCNITLKVV